MAKEAYSPSNDHGKISEESNYGTNCQHMFSNVVGWPKSYISITRREV